MRLRPSKRLIPVIAGAFVLLNFDAAFACSTKAKAYQVAMKSDLRNLVSAEESYFADNRRYTASLSDLGFRTSTGVAALDVTSITDSGWVARATHTQLPEMWCVIYVGPKPNQADFKDIAEGEPRCLGNVPGQPSAFGLAMIVAMFFVLVALAIAALLFLRVKDRRNWGVAVVVLSTFVYFLSMLSTCGGPPVGFQRIVALVGVACFAMVVRRRLMLP